MRLDTSRTRTRYAAVGVPAAVLGVVATALSAAPAAAAEPGADRLLAEATTPTASAPGLTASARIAPASTTPTTCVVQPGDTVSSIAARYGLATADVLAWNDLGWRSVIYPGQTLVLTGAAPASSTPAPAPTASTDYTIVAGDTLFAIAQRHGTTVAALLAANGLAADSIIYPGQKLSISADAPASSTTAPTSTASTALNAPQAENAGMIIRIGHELGVSDRGIAIALATAMVESGLRNLEWGDRDSLGLFQQRPSTGWGTAAQILDRDRSIRAFYGGQADPNGTVTRGLLDIPGWESMGFADAAQSVQISAYPDRYSAWEAAAYEWIALHG